MMTEGLDGAEGHVAGHAMAKGFTMHTVLLVSVGEGDVGPSLHIMHRAVTGGDALDESAAECCVGKLERLTAAAVSGGGEGIFSRGRRK